jgi:hypothetical protein
MIKNDLEKAKIFFIEASRFVRDNVFIFIIFLFYFILLPVQVIIWLKNRKPWGQTQPYILLNYLLIWCEATRKSDVPGFTEWKSRKIGKIRK